MNKRKLSNNTLSKYKLIVDEWFVNKFNGATAYKKYFPNVKKDGTASANFSKIQKLPEVQEYIKQKHEEAARIIKATHEGVLRELLNWLEFDMTETLGLTVAEIKLLPVVIRRMITGHKTRTKRHYDKDGNLLFTEEVIELKFVSKERAAEMINKHIGFYEADNEQKSNEVHIYTTNDKHKSLVEDIISGKKL